MSAQPLPAELSPAARLAAQREALRHNNWTSIAAHADFVPDEPDGPWLEVADEAAFALGQLGEYDRAAALLARAWAVEPTWRRASAMAYQHYRALWDDDPRPPTSNTSSAQPTVRKKGQAQAHAPGAAP